MAIEKGKIRIVLLPGLDGTGLLFEPFIQKCPEGYLPEVIQYPHDRPHSYTALEEIIESKIPGNDKFLILGESFSGPNSAMSRYAPQP